MKVKLERIDNNYLFEVVNSNGHRVLLDNKSKSNGNVKGISPMELLLMGLAGCSSIDVVSILTKQKIFPTSIKMEVDGEREPGAIPALFKKINVTVILEGDILEDKAKRAVNLSFDKYCSVSKTLEHTAEISYSILLNGQKIM
ncbi:MAG: osmotically inducible protein OsmC [Flavobacteriaceae bacterium]|nr:osmotically inducible protein OsmC [Flavobacteriaceae bacterium]|tara:strand:+ start:4063 stop:4491 length:429 start_codon:yes stop_codon:yes gene_type:complete